MTLPPSIRHEAATLSARLPSLVIAARRVAQTVRHGVHGRRRAGSGETFWQFRPFLSGEPSSRVDWRRSAREERAFVREREWEAAHTVWIWFDRSPSMQFASSLAQVSKVDRAALLALAFADLCVRGGERAGLLGLTRPLATQGVVERFAEAIATDERLREPSQAALPPPLPAAARSMVLMIGDFLSDPEDVARAIRAVSAEGAIGELVMIVDPIEETYPFSGHTEFLHPAGSLSLLTPRAQNLRDAYLARLAAHREGDPGSLRPLRLGHEHPSDRRIASRDPAGAAHAPFRARTRRRPEERLSDVRTAARLRRTRCSGGADRPRRALFPVARYAAELRIERYFRRCGFSSGSIRTRRRQRARLGRSWRSGSRSGALIILAMAEPLWNSFASLTGSGPLLVLIDDGFAAAPTWDKRIDFARERAAAAARSGRIVAVQPVSQGGQDIAPLDRSGLEGRLRSLAPVPYAPDRAGALPAIERFLSREPKTDILWIADGVDLGGASAFSARLASIAHSVEVVTDGRGALGARWL